MIYDRPGNSFLVCSAAVEMKREGLTNAVQPPSAPEDSTARSIRCPSHFKNSLAFSRVTRIAARQCLPQGFTKREYLVSMPKPVAVM